VRSLTRSGVYVFLTDSAVGLQEEDNLRHLVANLGGDVPRERVVPFLTSKHRLEYCLSYAGRAWQHDFQSLVVLGGDKRGGAPPALACCAEVKRVGAPRGRLNRRGSCAGRSVATSRASRWADGRTRI